MAPWAIERHRRGRRRRGWGTFLDDICAAKGRRHPRHPKSRFSEAGLISLQTKGVKKLDKFAYITYVCSKACIGFPLPTPPPDDDCGISAPCSKVRHPSTTTFVLSTLDYDILLSGYQVVGTFSINWTIFHDKVHF